MKPRVETEIRTLTGLRGLAAMMVASYHFIEPGPQTVPGPMAVVNHGYLCVDMFFVLSGFVMAYVYGRMFESNASWGAYGSFLVRRLARVYPLYLVTTFGFFLMFYFGLSRHLDAIPDLFGTLALNVTMIQTWVGAESFNGPAWSISVEWAAYLLFPALLSVTLFGSRRLAIATAAAGVVALVILAYVLPDSITQAINGPLDVYRPPGLVLVRCLAEFSMGLIAYRVAVAPSTRRWAGGTAFTAAVWVGFVVLMAVPGSDVLIVMTYPLMLLTLVHGTGLVARVFASRLAHVLGILSYSIYLLHWRFISVPPLFDAKFASWGALAHVAGIGMAYAATIGCAALSYRYIEKPSRKLIRDLTTRGDERARAGVAAS